MPGRTHDSELTDKAGDTRAGMYPSGQTQLLLVSSDPRWGEAVESATSGRSDLAVSACDARSALVRLAGGDHVSHLLVEERCAGGLLDELIELAAAHADRSTRLVILGGPPREDSQAVPEIDAAAVRRALCRASPDRTSPARSVHATDLHDALSVPLIGAHYQPIVRLLDRSPVALEVLARMRHPAHGTLLPNRFVPQMEDAGLAGPLTRLVCPLAFADLTAPPLLQSGLGITLNFPLDVLLCPHALDTLDAQREAAGVAATQVVVELTESRPVENVAELGRALERLRARGYGAAIDDAGPAVPDLAPLLDMPFTCLKLDKAIIQGSEHSAEALDFLQRTAAAAQARGMRVIAEGIESGTVWDLMLSLGLDEAQGFFVARPLPATAVPVWLEAWQGAPPP